MTPPAPQRAQRVRGVPGVGLRAPDGREWVRDGHSTYAVVSGMRHETCTVRFCGRPSRWGNPFETARIALHGKPWVVTGNSGYAPRFSSRADAYHFAIECFTNQCMGWPDNLFMALVGYDFLSCFCPLNSPCHIDAIIAEGVARGIWTPGETT